MFREEVPEKAPEYATSWGPVLYRPPAGTGVLGDGALGQALGVHGTHPGLDDQDRGTRPTGSGPGRCDVHRGRVARQLAVCPGWGPGAAGRVGA